MKVFGLNLSVQIDVFCMRGLGEARNISQAAGFWSSLWCLRVESWSQHVQRGSRYDHMCASLLNYNDSNWLMHRRSRWVAHDGLDSRYTLLGGRTVTRCVSGGPQPRWGDGVALAKATLQARQFSQTGRNAVSVGTRIREALVQVRRAAQEAFPRLVGD